MLHVLYERYNEHDPREISTMNMIASYGNITGVHGGKLGDSTANLAIRDMSLSSYEKGDLEWLDCVFNVYKRGIKENLNGLGINERRRRATVTFLLYYRGFLGYSVRRISEMPLPFRNKVSVWRIYDLWDYVVEDVAKEAIKLSLF